MDVIAARDHMTHLVYQVMQPQVVYDRLVHVEYVVLWHLTHICLFPGVKLKIKPVHVILTVNSNVMITPHCQNLA